MSQMDADENISVRRKGRPDEPQGATPEGFPPEVQEFKKTMRSR
jgi:hypothetical protein